jgi:acyl-homoserine-lactone acylase
MRMHIAAALGMMALAVQASAAAGVRSEVARTTHGIVHVKANDYRSLGYGTAYAYAQDNVCMLADTLLTVRGERSRYFGGDAAATAPKNGEYGAAMDTFYKLRNVDSDFFFKGYLDLEQLRAGYAAGSPDVRELLAGYADGYNRFLTDYRNRLPNACRGAAWVKPITVDDVYLLIAEKAIHASGEVFAAGIVGAARDPSLPPPTLGDTMPAATQPLPTGMKAGVGSNGIAIGSDASANGRGILLGNPHYPWTSTDRFYQLHLTIPGKYDAMGVSLGGLPMVSIGFNKDVAWTHTVTAAFHFTTFALTLDPSDSAGTTYVYDGAPVKMSERRVAVDVLQADGTIAKKQRVFYFSKQGAVFVMPEAGVGWTSQSAFVLADANRLNTRLPEQWLAIGKADSVGALQRSANAIVGLPWVNTIAADSDGNALYIDASAVPHMAAPSFASNCMVVPALLGFDGSRSECGWGQDADAPKGLFGAANMPTVIRKDYVANSNDNYWLANAKAPLMGPAPYGYSPMYGTPGTPQSLRTRIGLLQVEAELADQRFLRADDLQRLLFNDRVHAAELVLPELLKACFKSHDLRLLAPCTVLSAWDRKANVDSRGAVLFREFWNTARVLPGLWSVAFNPADPVNTPRGVSATATPALLDALRGATDKLQSLGVPLYGRLGDYQTQMRNGRRIGLPGGQGDEDGVFNVVTMATDLTSSGYRDVAWGTSYVQLVGFDNAGPVAKGLLTYGQSVDPQSPYYADQLSLFTQKTLATLPFTEAQIRTDRNYTRIVLTDK